MSGQEIAEAIQAAIARTYGDGSFSQADFGRGCPGMPEDLDRWARWALICFLRHERRQRWVASIVEAEASTKAIAARGSGAHPAETGKENLPAGWTKYYHGRGCCLTHTNGTKIDVDFADDGSAIEIDTYFYSEYLRSVPHLQLPEQQIVPIRELVRAWRYDLQRLETAGLIRRGRRFRLSQAGRKLAEQWEPICDRISELAGESDPNKKAAGSWLAAWFRDGVLAAELAKGSSITFVEELQNIGEGQFMVRSVGIQALLPAAEHGTQYELLEALACTGRSRAEPIMLEVMAREPVTLDNHTVLLILEHWNSAEFVAALQDMVKRFGIGEHTVDSNRTAFLIKVCRKLLSISTEDTLSSRVLNSMVAILAIAQGAWLADAAALLYLIVYPAMPGFERALSSAIPIVRLDAAAYLGAIGSPEAIEVLKKSAAQSPQQGGHEAACALAGMKNPEAIAAAKEWMERNAGYENPEPHAVPGGSGRKVLTFEEWQRRTLRSYMGVAMKKTAREYLPLLRRWKGAQD